MSCSVRVLHPLDGFKGSNFNTLSLFPMCMVEYICFRGISCGIYPSNLAEACLYCLQTSGTYIVIVEDDTQLRKILEVRSRTPDLKIIIQYSGIPADPSILSVSIFCFIEASFLSLSLTDLTVT